MARKQILVVDDNRDAADALAMALELLGGEPVFAYDGASALARLESLSPALMVLDLSMPGMDGYTLVRTIRAQPRFESVPIIALSGFGSAVDRERSAAAGFDRHLLKPIEFSEIEALLQLAH